MPEKERSQLCIPAGGATGCDAHRNRYKFRDQIMVGQGRLQADVGSRHQRVGKDKRVRGDMAVGFRECIYAPPELDDLAAAGPARELAAHIGRVHIASQEQPGFKYRDMGGFLQEFLKFHSNNIPYMVI